MENNYQQIYTNFMSKYQNGSVGPEEIGSLVAMFGQFYGEANTAYSIALKKYNLKNSELVQTNEENGKPMSSAKAQTLADASPEGLALIDAKTDRDNIEKQIMTLSIFQRGVETEFSKASNM